MSDTRNFAQEALLADLVAGRTVADVFGLAKVHAEEATFASAEDEAEYREAHDLDPREQADENMRESEEIEFLENLLTKMYYNATAGFIVEFVEERMHLLSPNHPVLAEDDTGEIDWSRWNGSTSSFEDPNQ